MHNSTRAVDLNNPGACSLLISSFPSLQNPSISALNTGFNVTQGVLQKMTVTIPTLCMSQTFNSGVTYTVNILAKQGNVVTFSRQK